MAEEATVPEWAADLPEELHDVPFMKDTKDLAAFKSNLVNAAQHMGQSVRIPGPDAASDDWDAFDAKLKEKIPNLARLDLDTPEGRSQIFTKLGMPEAEDGYGAGDEFGWLAKVAHASNLTTGQFKALVENLDGVNKGRKEESAAERAVALDALFTEWGLAKPKNMENIAGLLKLTNAPEAEVARLAAGTMDASTLKWYSAIASQFAEVAKFSKDKNENEFDVTPGEAHEQIQEILRNPAYFENTPYAVELRKKMFKLQQAANPGAATDLSGMTASLGDLEEMFGE